MSRKTITRYAKSGLISQRERRVRLDEILTATSAPRVIGAKKEKPKPLKGNRFNSRPLAFRLLSNGSTAYRATVGDPDFREWLESHNKIVRGKFSPAALRQENQGHARAWARDRWIEEQRPAKKSPRQ